MASGMPRMSRPIRLTANLSMGVTMLAACLISSALLLAMFHCIKRSLPARHARCILVQEKLSKFAIANRTRELTSAQIEQFWAQTSNTYSVYGITATNELRNELYQNALLLLSTKNQLSDSGLSDERHTQLAKLHADTVQWFSAALVQMDSDFTDIHTGKVSAHDVWEELLRVVSQSLRA